MTPFDANRLAIRYHNIWRGGPTTTELTTALLELDADRVDHTLTHLANTHDYPPTIAHIQRTYQASRALEYGWPRPEDTGPPIALTDYLELHPEDTPTLRK